MLVKLRDNTIACLCMYSQCTASDWSRAPKAISPSRAPGAESQAPSARFLGASSLPNGSLPLGKIQVFSFFLLWLVFRILPKLLYIIDHTENKYNLPSEKPMRI